MIGFINHNKVFEFRDIDDLAFALNHYGDQNNCDIILILDTGNRVKGLLYRGIWKINPDIDDDIKYSLYKITSYNSNINIDDIQRNDSLVDYLLIDNIDRDIFTYVSCKVPKTIN